MGHLFVVTLPTNVTRKRICASHACDEPTATDRFAPTERCEESSRWVLGSVEYVDGLRNGATRTVDSRQRKIFATWQYANTTRTLTLRIRKSDRTRRRRSPDAEAPRQSKWVTAFSDDRPSPTPGERSALSTVHCPLPTSNGAERWMTLDDFRFDGIRDKALFYIIRVALGPVRRRPHIGVRVLKHW